jgi:hypothetical protein
MPDFYKHTAESHKFFPLSCIVEWDDDYDSSYYLNFVHAISAPQAESLLSLSEREGGGLLNRWIGLGIIRPVSHVDTASGFQIRNMRA